jgi:hypothetical protein
VIDEHLGGGIRDGDFEQGSVLNTKITLHNTIRLVIFWLPDFVAKVVRHTGVEIKN